MPDPAADLAALIADIDDMPAGLSVYAAPSEKITAPAVVIRPDKFCHDLESYTAVVVVTANTPEEGIGLLRSMLLKIIDALISPWNWIEAQGPVVDQSTGVPFLAARLRLTYSNGGPE